MKGQAAFLAVLLLVAPVTASLSAGVATAPATAVETTQHDSASVPAVAPNETLNRLGVGDGPVVSGFGSPSRELSVAAEIGDREFRAQMFAYRVSERLSAAKNASANRSVLRTALDRMRDRVAALHRREATAVRDYHAGAIGERELFRRLARIDSRARAYRRSLDVLVQRRDLDGMGIPFSMRTRIQTLKRALGSLESPIRDYLNRSFRGRADGSRVHVVASGSGLVLEWLDDGTYVRDAVRLDHYAPEDPPSVGLDGALDRIGELYPSLDLDPASPKHTRKIDPVGDSLWRFDLLYPQGESIVYLDRSTSEIYHEIHRLPVDRIPTTTLANRSVDNLRVVVNGTGEGNPYLVSVTDARTGERLDATVKVANRSVGTTGPDGELWTLGPYEEFTVEVGAGTLSVNVTVPTRVQVGSRDQPGVWVPSVGSLPSSAWSLSSLLRSVSRRSSASPSTRLRSPTSLDRPDSR